MLRKFLFLLKLFDISLFTSSSCITRLETKFTSPYFSGIFNFSMPEFGILRGKIIIQLICNHSEIIILSYSLLYFGISSPFQISRDILFWQNSPLNTFRCHQSFPLPLISILMPEITNYSFRTGFRVLTLCISVRLDNDNPRILF